MRGEKGNDKQHVALEDALNGNANGIKYILVKLST